MERRVKPALSLRSIERLNVTGFQIGSNPEVAEPVSPLPGLLGGIG
jgi:hypothetical protein